MTDTDWLKSRFAHRGLHCHKRGVIENTLSAFLAAIEQGYGIELDVQPARCGTPVVFHDERLERLSEGQGRVADHLADELRLIRLRSTPDRILPLTEVLRRIDGQVPVLVELKSDWSGDLRFARRVADVVSSYFGKAAVMSFDPVLLLEISHYAPELPHGLIAEHFSDPAAWPQLTTWQRWQYRHLLPAFNVKPDFIAFDIHALPAAAPCIARRLFNRPLLTWTVRTETEQARAARFADGVIFEQICRAAPL